MDHPVKHENMRELAAYEEELRRSPRLSLLFLELTNRCNLRCAHCGSRCGAEGSAFLPLDAMERTLRRVSQACDPGEIMVCLTGGEPLLHPDVLEVIRCSASLGFPVGITTNGTLIDGNFAKELVAAGLTTAAVSIDGERDAHDRFRRSEGSFDRAFAGIRALRLAGLEPEVVTVVHRGNIGRLEAIYRLLLEEGICAWRLSNVDPIGRAKEGKDLLLTGPELEALYAFIREKRTGSEGAMVVSSGCAHFAGLDFEHEIRDFYFQCIAGTRVAGIRCGGEITGCLDIEPRPELVQGNILTDDFVDVWEHRYGIFRRDRTKESERCRRCGHRTCCRGDSMHTWDFDAGEPLYCLERLREEQDGTGPFCL